MPKEDCETQKPEDRISVQMYDDQSPDQLTRWRGKCVRTDCDVRKAFLELKECTKRVMKKIKYTAETCQQETVDFVQELDKCTKQKAFSKLK